MSRTCEFIEQASSVARPLIRRTHEGLSLATSLMYSTTSLSAASRRDQRGLPLPSEERMCCDHTRRPRPN
jgi:hypothetical protein